MAAHLSRLIADPAERVEVQATTFSIDLLGRYVCSAWEEALTNPDFDAVIIGSGMYGAYCADKLYRNGEKRKLRVLVLEAGSFLLPEHVQNLPNIPLRSPPPLDTFLDNGQPRNLVWGLPWRSNEPFTGAAYCVGGKSLFWGGWCPRLTEADLAAWPTEVVRYLQATYPLLERQTGVAETTDFIQGPLYAALLARTAAVLGAVPALTAVEPPPLAVQGNDPASGFFVFNKYSSAALLVSAIRDAVEEAGNDDSKRRLFLVPKAHVTRLEVRDKAVREIEVYVQGRRHLLPIAPECAVVLAAGAIESTRLALESFPTASDVSQERMGRNLMIHLRTNTTVRIRRSALESAGITLPEQLQTAALLARGATPEGQFHLQITAASDPDGNADALLFRMVPDIDQVDRLLAAQKTDWVSLTLRGCAETKGDRQTPVGDPEGRWIQFSTFERDEFGMRRAFVRLMLSPAEKRLWEAMDRATIALAQKLAGDDPKAIEYLYAGAPHAEPPALGTGRDGLGTTYHEAGTLWMGEDPATSITDVYGRFHHVANAYCADQALFPTVGSANPVLTGLTLARRVAEKIAQ